jgi:hypothetical protein
VEPEFGFVDGLEVFVGGLGRSYLQDIVYSVLLVIFFIMEFVCV